MKKIIITAIVFLLPLAAMSQNNNSNNNKNTQKKVVNVNKLEVIYQDQDDEYQGIVVDQPGEQRRNNIPKTLMQPDGEPDEELETSSQMYRPEQMGDGVESEFDILYATMDSTVIHYASNAELPNGVTIHLTDKEKGRKFCFPTPEHARMSSHFGARRRRWHYGVDLAMPTGEPIYAAFDGIVRISRWNRSYGNLVVVRHFNGLETYYAHLSQRDVEAGDTVRAGQVIALCGNTGRSYGSHLHFEIRYMGKAMNPEYVVDCADHKLLCDELVLTPAYFSKRGSSHSSPSASDLRRINQQAGTADNSSATVAENQKRDPSKPKPKATSKSQAKYYKVRSGDTLSKIAARNGTTVKKLCKLNGIKETTVLQIGKRLRVR
ncbi:MAG: peptidoglycan DD-metalloendopeptidase family protein [Bacteroidales bacterium]|nr:peptidoglycan DD-metalloendopeptidase family protein [Bacteroidales bacterium]